MNRLLKELEQWGADPSTAISRMSGDEALYLELFRKTMKSGDFLSLEEAMDREDYPAAFRVVHKMKGASGMLYLEPLSRILSLLTEYLRPYYEEQNGSGNPGGRPEAGTDTGKLKEAMEELRELCARLQGMAARDSRAAEGGG